jgi:thioredoxin reductase
MIMQWKKAVIIGAGPAGIACAIQLKRSGIEPYLIERDEVGGLLLQANLVENYPGFPSGISGEELVRQFTLQLKRFKITPHKGDVERIEQCGEEYLIRTGNEELSSSIVIVATGTRAKMLDTGGTRMNGALHFDIRPLRALQDKDIAVIGGGDAAFDYALALSAKNRVSIFFRRAQPSCLRLLYDRARHDPSIRCNANCDVQGIQRHGEKHFVVCGKPGGAPLDFDRILCAIGRIPDTGLLSSRLLQAFEHASSLPNLHYIGDVRRGNMRQVGIAVGDGLHAAMLIREKIG